jgi:hypothetical protein
MSPSRLTGDGTGWRGHLDVLELRLACDSLQHNSNLLQCKSNITATEF